MLSVVHLGAGAPGAGRRGAVAHGAALHRKRAGTDRLRRARAQPSLPPYKVPIARNFMSCGGAEGSLYGFLAISFSDFASQGEG